MSFLELVEGERRLRKISLIWRACKLKVYTWHIMHRLWLNDFGTDVTGYGAKIHDMPKYAYDLIR
jgi:hypothetical protein